MKFPEFLPKNGRIGFIAPSFGCNIEPYHTAFQNALHHFEQIGYQTVLGPNCYEGRGIGISNTPEKCGQEIMDYYCGNQADVLISCGGGELMCEDLDYVDFEALKKADPKWFLGYSDNTNLSFLLTTLCDTASVYGPCAAAFGMEPWHASIQTAFDVLTGTAGRNLKSENGYPVLSVCGYDRYEKESLKDEEHPLAPYHVTEKCIRRAYPDQDCHIQGRLIGGCLDILDLLSGTRFDGVRRFNEKYRKDGIIWFMEACDLNVMSIRRAIWQLKETGWFQYVRGFLIGRPMNGEELFGLDRYEAVTGILSEYDVPILMDLDIGHIPPQMPLILGSYATVDLHGNDLTIQMELRP